MQPKLDNQNFSKIVRWIAGIFTAVILLNFSVSLLAVFAMKSEVDSIADNAVNSGIRELNNALSSASQLLYTEVSYDSDIQLLADEGTQGVRKLGNSERYIITKRLKRTLESWGDAHTFSVNYLIYIPDKDIAIHGASDDDEYLAWYKAEKSIKNYLVEHSQRSQVVSVDRWQLIQIDGIYYMTRYCRMNNYYMMSWIDIDDYMENAAFVNYSGDQSYMVFLDSSGQPVNNQRALEAQKIDFSELDPGERRISTLKGQIVTKTEIQGADFSIGVVLSGYQQVVRYLEIQVFIGVLLLITGVTYVWLILYIRRTVLRPIEIFSENVTKLQNDENYNVATYYQITELGKASELLAGMVNRIKGLKIDIYEKTLEEQKIQTDFLSLQIEPHFYLNCLNIIYNLAELEKYREIQRLSRCVSDYLRYIFKKHDDVVLFGDELEHIKRYLEIQKIRYRNGFDVIMNVEDDVLKAVVPPLFVQTFVENAIKHTINWDESIEIVLTARVETGNDGEQFVEVIIEDSGEGFEEGILSKLQNGGDISEGEHRIGIMNAIRRLNLSYGDRAAIRFYNRVPHGAGVYIRIPYQASEDDGGAKGHSIRDDQ